MAELNCPLRQQATNQPEQLALIAPATQWSFAELDAEVDLVAKQLGRQLQPGQILMAIGDNSPELLMMALACLRSGIWFAPVNPRFSDLQLTQLARRLNAAAVWIGAEQSYRSITLADGVSRLSPKFVKQSRRDDPVDVLRLEADQPVNLILTSGSSGDPKLVVHSYANHYHSALGASQVIPLNIGDRWLLSLPLFHIGGLAILYRCLLAGACVVIADPAAPLRDTLARQRISHLSLVSTQLQRLLEECPEAPPPALKYLLLGGGAIDDTLLHRASARGLNCFTSYGMTEMTSQICTGLAQPDNRVGSPLPCREVAISEEGEILVRGKTLALGYLQRGQIRPITDHQGWFHTRDRGRWSGSDGQTIDQLQVTGRMDNQFVSGGENIQPEQIERALLAHPQITTAIVVPVASSEYGQRPVAFLDPGAGGLAPEMLNSFLAERLARYQIPDHYLPLPADLQPGIKPDRVALKRRAQALLKSGQIQVR